MTPHFSDTFLAQSAAKKSPLCIGLDPHMDLIPDAFTKNTSPSQAIEDFLIRILDAVHPYCAVVKPNMAFFEIWGADGWRAMERVCEHAQSLGLLVLADAKRGDIGSTAMRYAEAFLGEGTPYNAITINPYLGQDGILPFVQVAAENGKGVFCLVKTSNPSAGEFQDLPVGDTLLHEEVARCLARIGSEYIGEQGYSLLGAVVGATHSDDISVLRSEMPAQLFLVPGYGAQGGGADDIASAFYSHGTGAMVSSSRGILFPKGSYQDPITASQQAAQSAQEELYTCSKTNIFEKNKDPSL